MPDTDDRIQEAAQQPLFDELVEKLAVWHNVGHNVSLFQALLRTRSKVDWELGPGTRIFVGSISELAEDQFHIEGTRGYGRESFRAHTDWASLGADAQSELGPNLDEMIPTDAAPAARHVAAEPPIAEQTEPSQALIDRFEQLEGQASPSQWLDMLSAIEHTEFSSSQSRVLGPRLVQWAVAHRDEPQREYRKCVLSAIRSGASMLQSADVSILLPLLEPRHAVETATVTVKMIGRIFEAYPPSEPDAHPDVAAELHEFARFLTNPRVIDLAAGNAASLQLAVYALAAMGSSECVRLAKDVGAMNITWFTEQTHDDLADLRDRWGRLGVGPDQSLTQLLEAVMLRLTVGA